MRTKLSTTKMIKGKIKRKYENNLDWVKRLCFLLISGVWVGLQLRQLSNNLSNVESAQSVKAFYTERKLYTMEEWYHLL